MITYSRSTPVNYSSLCLLGLATRKMWSYLLAFGEHCVKFLVKSNGWQVVTMKTLSENWHNVHEKWGLTPWFSPWGLMWGINNQWRRFIRIHDRVICLRLRIRPVPEVMLSTLSISWPLSSPHFSLTFWFEPQDQELIRSWLNTQWPDCILFQIKKFTLRANRFFHSYFVAEHLQCSLCPLLRRRPIPSNLR